MNKRLKWNLIVSLVIYCITMFLGTSMELRYLCISATFIEMIFIGTIFSKIKMKNLKEESELNHQRYKMAVDAADGAVWEWDEIRDRLYISSRMKKVFGVTENIDSLEKMEEFLSEESFKNLYSTIMEIIENKLEKDFSAEVEVISREGRKSVIDVKGSSKVTKGVLSIIGIAMDVTLKKMEEENAILKEKRYRLALESTMDTMYYIDVESNSISINNKFYDEYKDITVSLEAFASTIIEKEKLFEAIEKLKCGEIEFLNSEFRVENEDGTINWLSMRGRALTDNGKLYIYGSIRNITDYKEKEIKINFMNYYDETTAIPNRRYFTENVEKLLKECKENNEEVVVLFIDLDNFKYVNDTYGHQVGDILLTEFAAALNKRVTSNSILARFGGDEFVVALRGLNTREELVAYLKNLVVSLNEPLHVKEREMYCSVSVGASLLSTDGDTVEVLLKKADMAMYKAKALGKNQFRIFGKEIQKVINRELEVKEGLRNAIINNEIYTLMQPKVRVNDKEIVGYECLARWQNEKLGFVSPVEFIKIAESTGLMVELGNYIIKDTFKKCKELTKVIKKDFKLAINLSEYQLREEDMIEFIVKELKGNDLDPKYIEFEITESVLMKSARKNIEVLIALRNIGFTLALDDFGTGYSSLNYLKMLPIDVLKMDKSFIDDVCSDMKSEIIIEKIIELSHDFNLKVVAEGVELEEQYMYLKNKGCNFIQGYYFSKPVTFESIINGDKLF